MASSASTTELFYNIHILYHGAGDVASGRREREADSGREGTARGHGVRPEPRPSGRGSHHGVSQPPVLCAHSGRLYDSTTDARYATHEVRLRPRLHSTPAGQHQLQTAAAMGQPDRQRKRSLQQWRIQSDVVGDSQSSPSFDPKDIL